MEGFVERVTATTLHRNYGVLLLRVLLIVGAVVWIYAPAFHGDWIWDDYGYLASHLHLQNPTELWKTWFAPGSLEDYYPVESAVLLVQWHLWHNATLGYHLTNAFLHVVNALLIWRLLGRIGLRHAWLGGLIFAIHPIAVDSVAWIVELKNTLSLPPLLLAMIVYVDYEDFKRDQDYFLALGLFLLSMLCKASVMMFPAVILLYVWWKRGRIGRDDLKATIPFFLISLLLGLLTACLQHQGGVPATAIAGGSSRIATVGWEMVYCFSKVLYPGNLLPIDPSGLVVSPTWFDLLPWLMLVTLLGLLWFNRYGWGRHLVLGIGFFLLNLVPVFAFALMNASTMIWTVDHVVYLPVIGLIGLAVAGWGLLLDRLSASFRLFVLGMTAMVLALLAWQSHSYAKIYLNEETFWRYTIQYNPGSVVAHDNYGSYLFRYGRLTEAEEQLQRAIQIDPAYYPTYHNLGLLLQEKGHFTEAEAQYEKAVGMNPNFADPQNNLGMVLTKMGRLDEAIEHFNAYLRLVPNDTEVHYNLANTLAMAGRLPEAMEQYEEALKLNPDFAEAHYSLGNALVQSSQLSEAATQYEQALRIKPAYADAHTNLGNALLQLGQVPEAIAQYEEALKLTPNDVDVRHTLGLVFMQTNRTPEAQAQFEAILQIDPYNAGAQAALAKIKASTKNGPLPPK
jgi:tetratricopeptide (TPR) repeat protein